MTCFALSRDEIPLYEYDLFAPIDTGLRYSKEFVAVKALLKVGASLDDIKKFYQVGTLDDDFVQFAIRFYYADMAYNTHTHDAIELERIKRIEAERKKGST